MEKLYFIGKKINPKVFVDLADYPFTGGAFTLPRRDANGGKKKGDRIYRIDRIFYMVAGGTHMDKPYEL